MCAASVRRRPAAGSATGRVWEIADELTRGRGSLPSGREVAEAYYREGGNEGTALTQYSYWKKAYLARVDGARPEAGASDSGAGEVAFPAVRELRLTKVQELRYGENPDQPAAFYADPDAPAGAAEIFC